MKIKGLLHVHSNNSFDGETPIKKLAKLAHKQNFSFICLTDHLEKQSNISKIRKECKENSDSQLKIIPGIEVEYKDSHILSINFLDKRLLTKTSLDTYNLVNSKPQSLAILAHPNKKRQLRGFKHVEVWNAKHHGSLAPKSSLFIKNNINFCGLDLHKETHFGKNWIEMKVSKLNEKEIIRKLKKGDFKICNKFFCIGAKQTISNRNKIIFILINQYFTLLQRIVYRTEKIRKKFPKLMRLLQNVY
jgi:predicted metal-dependent phosphoesterase TrpH